MPVGLMALGAYLPQRRLQRKVIAAAHSWFEPSLMGLGQGERTMASWDEDTITLAVEAARACLRHRDRAAVNALYIGSTSFPFLDRQNAALAGEALGLRRDLQTFDLAGSRKAGTSALLAALKAAEQGEQGLVVAADKRRAKAASTAEMNYGDGAAAMLVGETVNALPNWWVRARSVSILSIISEPPSQSLITSGRRVGCAMRA